MATKSKFILFCASILFLFASSAKIDVSESLSAPVIGDECNCDGEPYFVEIDFSAPSGVNCVREINRISVADQSLEFVEYKWYVNGEEESNESVLEYFTTTVQETLFSFEGTGVDGCLYKGEALVDFVFCNCSCEDVVFPNIFTPNGDEINDVFRLFYDPGCPITDFSLVIKNRWGQEVYDSTDPNGEWDGTRNGNPAPSDVYIYGAFITIGVEDDFCHIQGDLTLLR